MDTRGEGKDMSESCNICGEQLFILQGKKYCFAIHTDLTKADGKTWFYLGGE
jgi:hypothetical protein